MDELDRVGLRRHEAAAVDILVWLSESPKADLKTAAIELMGALGWESFLAPLERALSSPTSWEREAAIGSLAKLPGRRAAELLGRAADDADRVVRAAAQRALESRSAKGEDDR
jgi:HEAT repeat protein